MASKVGSFAALLLIAAGAAAAQGPVEEPPRIVLRSVGFAFDGAAVDPLSLPGLRLAAEWLQEHPDARLRIIGYTCELGGDVYNQSLSLQRAEGVRQVLVELGVSQDRLEVEGRGEQDPIAPNETPEGRALNRRVEFVVIQGGEDVRTIDDAS